MAGIGKYVLFVNNIPWTVGRQQLALHFSQFGHVRNATVVFDKQTGLNQGYGYIVFAKKEHMTSALECQHTLEGKNLFLSLKSGGNQIDLNNDNLN